VISYQPNAENRPPEITSVPAPILRRDLAMRVTNEARDPDYDDLIWSVDASGLPAGNDFSLDIQTGQVTWTPSVEGEFTVTYTVTDPDGATDQAQVTYTVLANAPPRFTSIPVRTGSVDQSYTYASQAVDPNGEVVEYFGDVLPTVNDFGRDPTHWPSVDAVIDPATGMLTWTPSAVGTYWVVLYASDPNEAIGTQAYFIEITDIGENQPPDILENPPPRRLLSPATSTQSAVPLDVMIPAIDPNNDPLSF
ncbi:MAG: putative Ig domain-containing protein, partial [Planctomycetota bacterium]